MAQPSIPPHSHSVTIRGIMWILLLLGAPNTAPKAFYLMVIFDDDFKEVII